MTAERRTSQATLRTTGLSERAERMRETAMERRAARGRAVRSWVFQMRLW